MRNKTLIGAAFAAALLGFGAAAQAQVATITIAPPAPRYEVVPAPREGWVWAPGHYQWHHGEYMWTTGHWMRAREGYEFREPRWVQRGNGEWVMVGNSWERRYGYEERHHGRRDYDADGVPDRFDRYPRNPNRS
jgi:hypothetical protein